MEVLILKLLRKRNKRAIPQTQGHVAKQWITWKALAVALLAEESLQGRL